MSECAQPKPSLRADKRRNDAVCNQSRGSTQQLAGLLTMPVHPLETGSRPLANNRAIGPADAEFGGPARRRTAGGCRAAALRLRGALSAPSGSAEGAGRATAVAGHRRLGLADLRAAGNVGAGGDVLPHHGQNQAGGAPHSRATERTSHRRAVDHARRHHQRR